MAEGADDGAFVDDDPGAEDDVRLDRAVAAELRVVAEPDAFRIDQGRALLHRFLAPPPLPVELEMGQLGAAVDARGLPGVGFDGDRGAAFGGGDHDDVGQIIFLRRIVVADLASQRHRSAERTAIMPLLHRRTARSASVASLYSTILAMVSPCAEDDPAIGLGIVGRRGEHDDRRRIRPVEPRQHLGHGFRRHERRVAVEDEDIAVEAGQHAFGLPDGMGGALLLGLVGDLHAAAVQRHFDLVAALADDDDALLRAKRVDRVEQMHQHRLAGDRVQHLVRVGAHARALAGGEHDDGKWGRRGHRRPHGMSVCLTPAAD